MIDFKTKAEKIHDCKPWLVERHGDELIVYGGIDANFPIVARIPAPPIGGNPAAEEMALMMASVYHRMFPALALIHREMRDLYAGRTDIPNDVRALIFGVSSLAHAVLPVPTLGED